MSRKDQPLELTKRENQIMAALYRDGAGTIADIAARIPDAPSDTALRTLLRILEDKGYVVSSKDGRRNVYEPAIAKNTAAAPALRHVLDTFFGGSLSGAVAAHLADPSAHVDADDIERLSRLIDQATTEND